MLKSAGGGGGGRDTVILALNVPKIISMLANMNDTIMVCFMSNYSNMDFSIPVLVLFSCLKMPIISIFSNKKCTHHHYRHKRTC